LKLKQQQQQQPRRWAASVAAAAAAAFYANMEILEKVTQKRERYLFCAKKNGLF